MSRYTKVTHILFYKLMLQMLKCKMQYSWLLKVFFLVTLVEDDLVLFLFIHCEILLPSL